MSAQHSRCGGLAARPKGPGHLLIVGWCPTAYRAHDALMNLHHTLRPHCGLALRMLLICAASLVAAAPVSAQPRFDFASTPTVLPKSVTPNHVRLRLDVDPQREQFSGEMSMQVTASEPVAAITLHASGLQASRAGLVTDGQRRTLRIEPDAKAGTWRLRPADGAPVSAGEHRLDIRYRGRVQAAGEGLYRVDHRVGGRPARMLATQLEATEARRVMPAFDEPLFRTVFELSVRAPAGYQVLSNMPLVRSTSSPARRCRATCWRWRSAASTC
jgi:aminopeptidase N